MADLETWLNLLLGSDVPQDVINYLGEGKVPLHVEITLGKAESIDMECISHLTQTLLAIKNLKNSIISLLAKANPAITEQSVDYLIPSLRELEVRKIVEIWLEMKYLRNKDGFERKTQAGVSTVSSESGNIEEEIEESKKSAFSEL